MAKKLDFPIVKVNKVYKSYKDVHAVRGIDLTIQPGEFVAILGPNGAGKTTLVEMIEGIQKPDKGEIFIKGKQWKDSTHAELNRKIGISLQETWFIEKLTVKETLTLFASFYKLDHKRVLEIIHLIQLEEKQKAYVKNLSGGQKQRLALGISLLNYPEILLLDEPTTGLDPTARRDVWNILLKLKKELNTSLILTTHYMEEAERLCDRIIIIDQGKILARGTLDELLKQCNSSEIIEITFNQIPPFNLASLKGVKKVRNENESYYLEVDKIINTLPEIMNDASKWKIKINTLECRKVTLDDLFISMTGRHLED
ncbi:MAG: ABC transporter ATP-binding protein [Bacteroidales bacterium]|nr:ABC transporter ATP-binding protein [Bacteroidales bacterium]